jgi:hypothetical protein
MPELAAVERHPPDPGLHLFGAAALGLGLGSGGRLELRGGLRRLWLQLVGDGRVPEIRAKYVRWNAGRGRNRFNMLRWNAGPAPDRRVVTVYGCRQLYEAPSPADDLRHLHCRTVG